MKMFNIATSLALLGLTNAACNTASTDSNYVCMISGAGINVHWKTDTTNNFYEMMVDAPQTGAAGYVAVGWNPTNPAGNKMVGATILMGGTADLNTVKMYSPADTSQANILATEAAVPATITQTAITSANNRINLKFRRSGVSTGNLLTIFAFGSTGTLSYHNTGKSSATIALADGVAPTPASSCNTASTDSNYVCMISGAGINVHWKTDTTNNFYEMMVDAPQAGADGFAAVGWNPTNPAGNKMVGATILMGGTADLNTVKMYSPADTVQANILATEAAVPATITQTAITSANNRINLKFRRSGVSTGSLLTIFAFGSTGTLSYHNTGKSSATIDLAHGVAATAPTPPPTPPPSGLSCTASTLIHTGTTKYDCMHSLSTAVTVHWNRETSGWGAVAATTTSTNGWFSVSFPQTAGSMSPATAVATSSATTAGIYSITAKSAAGITATTSEDINNPTTEVVNGMRILRFHARVSFLTADKPMNFAEHSTDIQFPSAKHTSKGSGNVDFVDTTSTPTPATPPTPTPVATCTPSTLIVTGSTTYDCMLALTSAVTMHWNRETTAATTQMAVTASSVSGWLAVGFPTTASSMTPATAVASSSTTGGVYAISARSASGIAPTTSSNLNFVSTEVVNGQRVVRFTAATSFLSDNMAVNYAFHSTNAQFPVSSAQHTSRGSSTVNFAAGTSQVVLGDRDFDDAHTHGGAMIAIWAYWVPLAMIMKGVGPLCIKGKIGDFPIPFVIHSSMMVIAMILTTVFAAIALSEFDNDVDYSHRELGIAILAIGWVQVLGGLAKPGNESSFRKYWGFGHFFLGTSIFTMAIFQMIYGIKNIEDLYPNEDTDPLKGAVIAGLSVMVAVYIIGKVYVACTKKDEPEGKDKEDSSSDSNEPDNEGK